MIPAKRKSEKTAIKKTKKVTRPRRKRQTVGKYEDVKKLVHLLQVHQIELEHQNEELRIAQEELEVSRNKYVNLFDFSPIPYFTLNVNGVIKEVNLSASNMFGVDRKKLIEKHFISYILLDDKEIFNSFIKNVFNSHIKHSCELKMINKDKRVYHVLLEGLELDDTLEQGNKCQVALIDLTEFKRVESSLKETNGELKVLNTTRDKFFSIIAHDLKNPFQSLLSCSELLATETGRLSHEEIISYSKRLNDNLNSLYVLLENLLNWSLMQRDMIDYRPVNQVLNDSINRIIEISNQGAIKKNIFLTNKVDTGTLVYADANMLLTIVHNLITNAIKFTPDNGQIIVSAAGKEGFVEVSVQDTGIGIEPGKSSALFNFNTISTTSGTNGEKGTGLGLPLCKEFVERNGGKIWVESEFGKGSKFTFTLQKAIL